MRAATITRDEDGFTIVEVLVAAVVLVVGILGVTTMVNSSNATITSNKAREQGLALAREIIESARSVRYQALRPATAVQTVQAMPGLGDASAIIPGWTIHRRGINYSVALGVCSVDDPGDKTGAHVGDTFCGRSTVAVNGDQCKALIGTPAKVDGVGGSSLDTADCGIDASLDGSVDSLLQTAPSSCPTGTSVEAGTCDAQPDDFKRLVVLVTWDRGAGNRYVLQQATESFPGLSAYASITKLELHDAGPAPSGGYVIRPDASGNNVDKLRFDAWSSENANQVNWLLDGADKGLANWSGSSGSFEWSLGNNAPASETAPAQGEVVDGSYSVSARVQDAGGIHGAELSTPVTLNRRIPFPPGPPSATVSGGIVTITFAPPGDQDIIGYRLYRITPAGTTEIACAKSPCTDNPSSSGSITYQVAALDRDASGNPRAGQKSLVATVNSSPTATAPPAPATFAPITATECANQACNRVWATLSWSAVSFSPAVTDYIIYRDSTTSPWSSQSAANGTTWREIVRTSESHDYWVAAKASGIIGPKIGPRHFPAP